MALGHAYLFFDAARRFPKEERDRNGGFRINPS
jgi:hypothetical protein